MGRGQEETAQIVKRSFTETKRSLEDNLDLLPYVKEIDFREGFLVSFVHEARQNTIYEVPRFSGGSLKRPSLLVSFTIDKEKFYDYDETFDLKEDDNLKQRLALYIANRILPFAEGVSPIKVARDYSFADSDQMDEKVPLQNISFSDKEIHYSLALS